MRGVMRTNRHRPRRSAAVMVFSQVVAAAACAGDDSSSSETDDSDPPSSTSLAEQPSEDSGPEPAEQPGPTTVSGDALEQVRAAVFRIETVGAVVEPDESLLDPVESIQWGGGTGFVIDPSGLAVTNQHVVAGAATIKAFVAGSDEPVLARVVGLSLCSDLAVIDLDGDGYTALDWYDGEVEPGLEVFVAGFPLGDPEYTLLDGIVSKARTDGETSWASVDWVIEHTAPTLPGNSGGPVVTPEGQVVAVNYAYGQPVPGSSQYFAIAREVALPVIDELASGAEGLGLGGQAVVDDVTGVSGVWVSTVDSGSPADLAGIEPGDIIERLEGLSVGADGTLEDYCDVLRTHLPDDTMAVQVLRFADDMRLRGSLNGRVLAPVESLGQEVDEVVDVEASTTAYEEFVLVNDDYEALEVEVPVEWAEVDGYVPFRDSDDNEFGVGLRVAPDLEGFLSGWSVPGLTFSADQLLTGQTAEGVLDHNVGIFTFLDACTQRTAEGYDDGLYVGVSQLFTDCNGTSTSVMLISAIDEASETKVFLSVQIVTDADLAALDRIIETFLVVGSTDGSFVLAPETYSDYQQVYDDTGTLVVEVPVEWTHIRSGRGFHAAEDPDNAALFHGVGLNASTDIDAWRESWGVPGIRLAVTDVWNGDIDGWFYQDDTQDGSGGLFYRTDCVEDGVYVYEDALYSGLIGYYTDCGGGDTELTVIIAAPPDDEFVILLAITSVTDADDEAYVRILETFQVVGEIPDRDVELAPEEYSGYQEVFDDTGTLAVEVPVEWTHIRSGPGFHDNEDPDDEALLHGVGLNVSTDIDAWRNSWGVPGVRIAATSRWNGNIDDWFYQDDTQYGSEGRFALGDCEDAGVYVYEDALYSGLIGYYTDCGGGETELTVIVAAPPGDEFVMLVGITTVTDADRFAHDRILETFRVVGDVPN